MIANEIDLNQLAEKSGVVLPQFIRDDMQYLAVMGSRAYGADHPGSDVDLVGWCIPPLDMMLPHLSGHIHGFGSKSDVFRKFKMKFIMHDNTAVQIGMYSVVEYFEFIRQNKYNILETLFAKKKDLNVCKPMARSVVDQRETFFHKGAFHDFISVARWQFNAIDQRRSNKSISVEEREKEDCTNAYHAFRIYSELIQLITTRHIDLSKSCNDLKYIRERHWSIESVRRKTDEMDAEAVSLFNDSWLNRDPSDSDVKAILMSIIESHLGPLDEHLCPFDETNRELSKTHKGA